MMYGARCLSIHAILSVLSSVLAFGVVQHEDSMLPLGARGPGTIAFSSEWQAVGPFQIGTREATWNADPLEQYGGFRQLEYDTNSFFRSSIAMNGSVGWELVAATELSNNITNARCALSFSFPSVDWPFISTVYGWAGFQYQAWARGEITVSGTETTSLILYTDQILEFWLDGEPYFGGDFYTYRKAPPVLHLEPGTHRIDIRLVRDVRAMGGIGEPTINVVLEMRLCTNALERTRESILISDNVNGRLVSPYASLSLRNSHPESAIKITRVQSSVNEITAELLHDEGLIIAPGQTRPISFSVSLNSRNATIINARVFYHLVDEENFESSLSVTQQLRLRSTYDPQKFTFMHPGGIVSYTIIRPPARNASCDFNQDSLPVLLQFHGAGVEAENDMVAHSLDPVADLCSWVLFPTGITPWSGDDWHAWGFADVEAAVASIPEWINHTNWEGSAVNIDRWIVSGHSNGGQGTWYALTHIPDKIVAAAPVSGYSSIQNYVPYHLWHPMEPRRYAVLQAASNDYRHELLVENGRGIPILQQHGSIDDNVPAFNSRLMSLLISQAGYSTNYVELPNRNHWFDTVMTTDALKAFYRASVKLDTVSSKLENFTFVVSNPGTMGSKGGFQVDHLEDPGQYGRIDVQVSFQRCEYRVRTSNILQFRYLGSACSNPAFIVDEEEITTDCAGIVCSTLYFSRNTAEKRWQFSGTTPQIPSRFGKQLGAMDAILRSKGPFIILYEEDSAYPTAVQISRNLYQYFSADSEVTKDLEKKHMSTGNVITISTGQFPPRSDNRHPIQQIGDTLSVRDGSGEWHKYNDEEVPAAIFLQDVGDDSRLELVIWGKDSENLMTAARLVPMLTGVGQPDFVLLGKSSGLKGVEGAVAMGFFDHMWNVTESSYFS
ncbi:hypothetical protein M501DRAFT_1002585 [Patellaria atrata CBS 101060]|uniref:Peptidase S9 prolyl oligopeptidase catalytic domain-containing protein n=1 Tax=Patellaria atrata CBS 101060 TaxID=1346257 RepID=A0A9P4VU55_9PEZI|nr:hypothetical protein M501DRAFT_1002585 [Patellaria atrata CBS 101060]